VKTYSIDAEPAVEADVEAAFDWYEVEEPGLGFEFLDELRAAYRRILDIPLGYQELRSGIRRGLSKNWQNLAKSNRASQGVRSCYRRTHTFRCGFPGVRL
jgi:hypothetical protein